MFLKLMILCKFFLKYFSTYQKYFWVEAQSILEKEEAFSYFLPLYMNNIYLYAYSKVQIDDNFFKVNFEIYLYIIFSSRMTKILS